MSLEADKNQPPRQPLVTIQQPQSNGRTSPTVIHFTLDGRAGKFTLPSNGLLLAKKLKKNLLPTKIFSKKKRKRIMPSKPMIPRNTGLRSAFQDMQNITFPAYNNMPSLLNVGLKYFMANGVISLRNSCGRFWSLVTTTRRVPTKE